MSKMERRVRPRFLHLRCGEIADFIAADGYLRWREEKTQIHAHEM